ncbi:MAG: hypothetical protein DHS20C15_11090 [Planctomycetota bacterium]|nr:MAG: hypothetical protein DHS20C15_11090 [Planctomycetota bacterium]
MHPQNENPQVSRPTRKKAGWLEGLVGLSIMVSLAGVVTPIVGSQTGADNQHRAEAAMLEIVHGLRAFSNDTLYLPTGSQGRTDVSWLYGPGVIPAGNPFANGGEARPLEQALLNSVMGGRNWAGPYVEELTADPWGNAFLVNVDGLIDTREVAMVLSAGPDGVVQTQAFDYQAAGDDLLMYLD